KIVSAIFPDSDEVIVTTFVINDPDRASNPARQTITEQTGLNDFASALLSLKAQMTPLGLQTTTCQGLELFEVTRRIDPLPFGDIVEPSTIHSSLPFSVQLPPYSTP